VEPASYSSLRAGEAGKLYYIKSSGGTSLFDTPEGSLSFFDLESREETSILDGVSVYETNAKGTKILALSNGSWVIGDAAGKIDAGKAAIPTGSIEVLSDPRAEWAQMLREAWRLNRDYFYDPGMHGVDWPAIWEKYKVFLPHLTTRADFTGVLQAMCGELVVGHSYTFGGDDPSRAQRVPGGLLGADFEVHQGRYRIAKVYGGLNWNPDLRSPLTEPGVDAVAGEYLLSVNGKELRAPDNLYRHFENTSGKIVELTLASSAGGSNSRTVQVVPITSELALRNRDWVEGNVKRVTEATNGRVAYVWVPNTAQQGHEYFKRYFFPQSDREAIIVDERHNGGGQIADYVINILQRPHISYWNFRYGNDLRTPQGSIQGPKVMLIDETAGSGGDLLPWMFRKFDMGTIIGRRTWGGLVGILGYPPLMDGGTVTAPNIAFFTEDGWEVENVGVAPDIEVVQWPKDQAGGRDPQLEKAIEVVMEQLEASPPQEVQRPPYPVKTKP
ncbi:MAG: peptidase S41, partial [Candidatus Eisenbacteria bacterium]|nr:peptidase S41 [Candidatus Eisenbacteria bacterium]